MIAAIGVFLNRAAGITGKDEYRHVAQRQVDWILGCNPYDRSSVETITLDGPDWTNATDPHDKGRDEKWFEAPRPEAQPATVPCTIQEVFPSYAGLAWYWKEFEVPKNPQRTWACRWRRSWASCATPTSGRL